MRVNKVCLLIGTVLVLSGCATVPQQSSLPKETDYSMFCKVDMSEVVQGSYIVEKIDQRYFYITSNGNVYSKNELDRLKVKQQENNNKPLTDQVQSKVKNVIDGIAGFNIMPSDNIDDTDVNTAKRVVIRKFISVDNPKVAYCTARLEVNDNPGKFTARTYKMVVNKSSGTNVDVYNNNSNENIALFPIY